MRVVQYDPSRRGDVAGLMERVWGERPGEEELAWFYERRGNIVANMIAHATFNVIGLTLILLVR